MKRLKALSIAYEDKKIMQAVQSSELDHNVFWKMFKRERDGPKVKTPSIKDARRKVVHEVKDILKVWQEHFSQLGTPVESEDFDNAHFQHVNGKIQEWLNLDDGDDFTTPIFNTNDIRKGIQTLNGGRHLVTIRSQRSIFRTQEKRSLML